MSDLKICPCGIAAVDCDYHKPETKEYFLGVPTKETRQYVYKGNGVWELTVIPDSKMDGLVRIAKQIGDYHQAQVRKALAGVFKDNEPV